jgi:hypothetical protein
MTVWPLDGAVASRPDYRGGLGWLGYDPLWPNEQIIFKRWIGVETNGLVEKSRDQVAFVWAVY